MHVWDAQRAIIATRIWEVINSGAGTDCPSLSVTYCHDTASANHEPCVATLKGPFYDMPEELNSTVTPIVGTFHLASIKEKEMRLRLQEIKEAGEKADLVGICGESHVKAETTPIPEQGTPSYQKGLLYDLPREVFIHACGHVPEIGETVYLDGFDFSVLDFDPNCHMFRVYCLGEVDYIHGNVGAAASGMKPYANSSVSSKAATPTDYTFQFNLDYIDDSEEADEEEDDTFSVPTDLRVPDSFRLQESLCVRMYLTTGKTEHDTEFWTTTAGAQERIRQLMFTRKDIVSCEVVTLWRVKD